MPKLRIDSDFELNYYDDDFTDPWKASPAVVLQHGISRDGRFWYPWVPLLGREYRVVRPDMRGEGLSTIADDVYEPSMELNVSDLVRLLDTLEIPEVVFVGESYGGVIGLNFAHAHPERIRALVLCNTPCPMGGRTLSAEDEERYGKGFVYDMGLGSDDVMARRLDVKLAPEGLVQWYLAESEKASPEISRKLHDYVLSLDVEDKLPEIDVPTLLLTGDRTPTAPVPLERFMDAHLPNSRLVVFENTGHSIHSICPERCVEELRKFVDEVA